jgi:hypothetical protein
MFLRNAGWLSTDYTALYLTGLRSSNPTVAVQFVWLVGTRVNRTATYQTRCALFMEMMCLCNERTDGSTFIAVDTNGNTYVITKRYFCKTVMKSRKSQATYQQENRIITTSVMSEMRRMAVRPPLPFIMQKLNAVTMSMEKHFISPATLHGG